MKRSKTALLGTLILLVLPILTTAQTQRPKPSITVIDGATNRSQIPDTIAYRLYFLVLTNGSQEANMNALGLDAHDREAAVSILKDFRAQDARTRESHATLARQGRDTSTFLQERDTLVDDARNQLREKLSLNGMRAIDNAAQENKSQIRIKTTTIESAPTAVAPTSAIATIHSDAVPSIRPLPTCPYPAITWVVSAAETNTYSISSVTSTDATAASNVVYDGTVTPTPHWGTACTPNDNFSLPTYVPHIFNGLGPSSTTGTPGAVWTSSPQPIAGGGEFSIGTVQTIRIALSVLNADGGPISFAAFGDGIDGLEGDSNNDDVPLVIEEVALFQFEFAYTRSAFTGSTTGCHPVTGFVGQLCVLSQQNWCTPQTSPPDNPILAVSTFINPPPIPPFFENVAACIRPSPGAVWSCTVSDSTGNYNAAPGLASCTKADARMMP